MKKIAFLIVTLFSAFTLTGCDFGNDDFTIVWTPTESGEEWEEFREYYASLISNKLDRTVVNKTTTDLNVAVEVLASGNAHMGLMGPLPYLQAEKLSDNVIPIVTFADNGDLDNASYNSLFAVKEEDSQTYLNSNNEHSLDNIENKKISFVSQSSSSGFIYPANKIINNFTSIEDDKDIIDGDFFSSVKFSGSHSASLASLFNDDNSDVVAFTPLGVPNIELVSGTKEESGAVYKVTDGEDAFLKDYEGEQFTIISQASIPNPPTLVNKSLLSEDEINKLQELFTSDDMTNDDKIFGDRKSGESMYEAGSKFVVIDEKFYDEIR